MTGPTPAAIPAVDLSERERRNLDGMRRLLKAKHDARRAVPAPRPSMTNDRRTYGKRGWTWTPR